MGSHPAYRRSFLQLALLILFVFLVPTAPAQQLDRGEGEFEAKARLVSRTLRVDLFKGTATADPKDKSHRDAVEVMAMEVVYPLYWLTANTRPPEVGKMYRQVEEFDSRLNQMTKFKAATSQIAADVLPASDRAGSRGDCPRQDQNRSPPSTPPACSPPFPNGGWNAACPRASPAGPTTFRRAWSKATPSTWLAS